MSNRQASLVCLTGQNGSDNVINANAESLIVDVEGLENVQLVPIQVVDGGTVTLQLYVSFDGSTFIPFGASIAESDFVAGANTSLSAGVRGLVNAGNIPMVAKQVKMASTAYGAGGTYKLQVAGIAREGYGGVPS